MVKTTEIAIYLFCCPDQRLKIVNLLLILWSIGHSSLGRKAGEWSRCFIFWSHLD